MPVNKLTDAICRKAQPAEKPYKLADGHGMYLWVSTTGAKVWRVGYRQFGKEGIEVIGPYPLLTLAEARTRRDAFRLKLLDGIDAKAKPEKIKPSISFSEASNTYWLGRNDISENYRLNATRGIAMHLEPAIGTIPIASVTRDLLLAPLVNLDNRGKHVYARRVRVWASLVFDWAVEHRHCPLNVAAQINPEKAFNNRPVEHHAALELSEVPDFLARLSLEKELQSVLACKLLALTWVRTGELRMMMWSEIEGDLWRVPKGRMKMRRLHLVPLSKQAQAILAELKLRSRGGDYVFPSDRRIDRPMSENSILYMLHRIGYKGRLTGHGFRSIASTWANEHGYNTDHIEMQLAHSHKDAVRGAYNHAAYLPQRRQMMQDFADWMDAQAGNA